MSLNKAKAGAGAKGAYDIIIYKDGTLIIAENWKGEKIIEDSDAATVINQAIANLPKKTWKAQSEHEGSYGSIFFKVADYEITSDIVIPTNSVIRFFGEIGLGAQMVENYAPSSNFMMKNNSKWIAQRVDSPNSFLLFENLRWIISENYTLTDTYLMDMVGAWVAQFKHCDWQVGSGYGVGNGFYVMSVAGGSVGHLSSLENCNINGFYGGLDLNGWHLHVRNVSISNCTVGLNIRAYPRRGALYDVQLFKCSKDIEMSSAYTNPVFLTHLMIEKSSEPTSATVFTNGRKLKIMHLDYNYSISETIPFDNIRNVDIGMHFDGSNLNFPTKNQGVATIPAGNTYVDVAHGLACAPQIILLSSSQNVTVWYSDVNDSTFRINIESALASDLAVSWVAKV